MLDIESITNTYKTIQVDKKQVREHRYIMECFLGRKLGSDEIVHHKDGNKKKFNYRASGQEYRIHPTQKPLKLFEQIINYYSNENDLIFDCFSGSGTTAVACHNLKRRFICIEKDYDYYKASVERLENAQAQMRLF